VVVGWPKGYIKRPDIKTRLVYFLRDNRRVFVGLLCLLVLFFYYFLVWFKFGRDPAKGTIIPLYEPPKGLSAALMRYIVKMGFDQKIFSVAVLDMAVKGFLNISFDKKTYTLIKKKDDESLLCEEEKIIARTLFKDKDHIELINNNYKEIAQAVLKLRETLSRTAEKVYFVTNKEYFIPGIIFSFISAVLIGLLGPAEKNIIAIFISFWITAWTIGVIMLLAQVRSSWKIAAAGLQKEASGQAMAISLFSLPFILGELFGIAIFIFVISFSAFLIFLGIIATNVIFYKLLKAPTFQGRKMLDKIEGFKMFLSVAEAERLRLLYPAEHLPEIFEKYLPYAFALDVEQAWCEKFSHILLSLGKDEETRYVPTWYTGVSSFNLGNLAALSSFNYSFNSAISSAMQPPGSSSGFSTSSGGGGFAGGGGGGGGGGGW